MEIVDGNNMTRADHPVIVFLRAISMGILISFFYIVYISCGNYTDGGNLWRNHKELMEMVELYVPINTAISLFSCFLVSIFTDYILDFGDRRRKGVVWWILSCSVILVIYLMVDIFYFDSPATSMMASAIICAAGTLASAAIAVVAGWFCRKLGAIN